MANHECPTRFPCCQVLANNSCVLEDFLENEGNRRINLTAWKRHELMGHVRDIQFTAPIKGAFGNWGVATTQCYQTHRYQGMGMVING